MSATLIFQNLSRRLPSLHFWRRKAVNASMVALLGVMSLVAILPLFFIFFYILKQGLPAFSFSLFYELPKAAGEAGGGIGHSILGSLILAGLASCIGIPWGIAAGIYLSEYGSGILGKIIRFCIEILSSVPSIIVGLFAYAVIVRPLQKFSALAGAASLAVIMVPIVARTTEELLRMVPMHIREAGLALGIPRRRVILRILLRGSLGGISTGVLLALARIFGETAPLLFTALSSPFWPQSLIEPIASLPVQIFNDATSPYEEWHGRAWAASTLLVFFVFLLNAVTRLILRGKRYESRD